MKKGKKRSFQVTAMFQSIQNYLGIRNAKNFIILSGALAFVLLYVLYTASQQVHPSDWRYTEGYNEGWMKPDFNASRWKGIELPYVETLKGYPAYYRGTVELSGLEKPDVVLGVRENVESIYINGEPAFFTEKSLIEFNTDGVRKEVRLSASLFKPGKNTVAVKIVGGRYRIIQIRGEKTTINESSFLLIFMLVPAVLLLVLERKTLDSDKAAVVVMAILALVFLKPIFHNFNYLGTGDWGQTEMENAISRETIVAYHQLPLWNPFVSGGQPLLADPQSISISALFPAILAFNVIAGMKIKIIIWFIAGLVGMYMLGRQMRLNTYSCYLMSFTYVFSSMYSLHVTQSHPQMQPMTLIPWAFLFYLKALEEKKYAILGALVMAFMIFDGALYTLVYASIILALYSVFASAQKWINPKTRKEAANIIATLAIIAILCSALSAVKVLPMLELFSKYPRPTTELDPDGSIYRGYTLEYLYHAFLDGTQTRYKSDLGHISIWDNFGSYIGPLAVILAIGGLILNFRRHWPLALIMLIGALLAYGTGKSEMVLWDLLHKLPIFSSMRYPSRFMTIALFSISIFAGLMLSRIEEKRKWLGMGIALIVFYNLLAVNTTTFYDAFLIAPRTITESKFTQLTEYPNKMYVYTEAYANFLKNQGSINYYASLKGLGEGNISSQPVQSTLYKGEAYLQGRGGSVIMKSFSPNRLVFELNSPTPDTLLINQDYDQGWKGIGKDVYSKGGIIAVDVSPLDRNVTLYYSPESFKIGLMITLLTIMLIVLYLKRDKKRKDFMKFATSLKDKKVIACIIAIIILSYYGVDLIQASGLYSENEMLLNGPSYKVSLPDSISFGYWTGNELKHNIGQAGEGASWESKKGETGYLIYGPYANVDEGRYNVIFTIKIEDNKIGDSSKVVTIEVSKDNGEVVNSSHLFIRDFIESNTYQNFTIEFYSEKPIPKMEFKAHYYRSPAKVNIKRVTLVPA